MKIENMKNSYVTETDLIDLGFVYNERVFIMSSYVLKLGRGRILCANDIETCNATLFIIQQDEHYDTVPDVVCLYNYDYDGKLLLDSLRSIIKGIRN